MLWYHGTSFSIKAREGKGLYMRGKFLQSGLPKSVIYLLSAISIAIIVFIFGFVFYRAWPVIKNSGLSLVTTGGFDSQIQTAFYATAEAPALNFGLAGLIYGTLMTTLISLAVATLIGIGAAITISEYTSSRISAFFIAIVRLLASVPSVVFGLVGIVTVVPLFQKLFEENFDLFKAWNYAGWDGRNMLTAIIVLTFMIVPTVVSLSVDAIRAVPNAYRETGYAFGMKKFRVVSKIVLPGARSGIIAGVVLAAGRGIGEAIAVSMVCGGLGNPAYRVAGLRQYPGANAAAGLGNHQQIGGHGRRGRRRGAVCLRRGAACHRGDPEHQRAGDQQTDEKGGRIR